ncbi:hypothetical protein TIFTF001_015462 [Ficus carica]|uniref:Uncharacterized protein n=1 Tax=Ficus carica TaxID=3494 RepID=A0AA88AHT1_FICCA|nr:hypothetical protein TIFTF001_015462 [Ficus carica]
MDERLSDQIPRAHRSPPPESQPTPRRNSNQSNEGPRRSNWSASRILYRPRHMRRRLRSATQRRTKGKITDFSRSRKASVRPIASCPVPPASTVYSSSGSNSINLEMPRKTSGETFVWNPVKERRLLEKLDDFYAANPGKQPAMQIYELWAGEFNSEFGGVPAHGTTLYQKKERMRKIYRGWKSLKTNTGLGHLRHEGLRHKELQFNVFEKTHAAGAYAYGSVTMGDASNPSVDYEFNFANSETHPCLEEDLTPPAGRRPSDRRQGSDVASTSRRSGSLGKRKQREATNAMAYEAMEEVRDYFRGIAQTGDGSEQSVQNDGLVQCMNIMKAMGYSIHENCRPSLVEPGKNNMNDRGSAHHRDNVNNRRGRHCQRNDRGMAAMSVFAYRTWRNSMRTDPVPMHNSVLTGQMRVHEILNGHPRVIQGATIQQAAYLFQHSKETTSRWFNAVLFAICALKDEFIRPPDYTAVQPLIQEHGYKYRPWFDVNYEDDDEASGTRPSTGPQHHDTRMDAMNTLRDMMADDMWERFRSDPWYRTT